MAKLQLNRGRINSTMTEDEVIKTSPFQLAAPQTEAGVARLGGLAENISPFKGVALNMNNVNALPNAMQS